MSKVLKTMNKTSLLLLIISTIYCFSACISAQKKYTISKIAVITPNEKYDDCIGFTENLQRNRANNCVYEHWSCFGNNRGQLLVYSKVDCGPKVDTILFIEYKTNKDWSSKRTAKPAVSNYPYIADGKCLFAQGYKERYSRNYIPNIYIEPIAQDSIAPASYDSWRNFIPGKDYIEYYRTYGRAEGRYKDGKREGIWAIEEYVVYTSFISELQHKIDSIPSTYFMEKIHFEKGKKEGATLQFQKNNQNENWRQTPIRSITYTNDAANGWLVDFQENSAGDSILYKNNEVVNK